MSVKVIFIFIHSESHLIDFVIFSNKNSFYRKQVVCEDTMYSDIFDILVNTGQYSQNVCQATDVTCEPCTDRLPSCIGLANGNHSFASRLWKSDYIVCYQNRTVKITKCSEGYFNARTNSCEVVVTQGM